MTSEDRIGIKNSILHYLCDDWNNHKRGRAHKENQALFDRKEGYAIWNEIDLTMVMDKVVKGIYAYGKCADYKQKYIEMLIEYDENLCEKCQNHIECKGDKCPKYQHGKGMTSNNVYNDWYWSCKDFNYGTCEVLEGTPCEGCFDENYKGFKLREET